MSILKKVTVVLLVFVVSAMNFCDACAALRPKAGEFPDKTIIIGAHAIVIDSLTQDLLDSAKKSVEETGQSRIYFKSDIKKGVWFDITSSTDASQISVTTDNIVDNSEIDKLKLNYYTNREGKTIDLRTGDSVETSMMDDIANPENLEELNGLKEELTIQTNFAENEKNSAKKNIYNAQKNSLENVLKPITSEAIVTIEKQLNEMDDFINGLKTQYADIETINTASQLKIQLLNQKKSLCYQALLDRMEEEITKLDYLDSGELISKYTESATKLQASLSELGVQTKKTPDQEQSANKGTSAFRQLEQESAEKLMEALLQKNKASATELLDTIVSLNQLQNNIPPDNEKEKQNQLLAARAVKQRAAANIENLAFEGFETKDYQEALNNGEPLGVLEKYQIAALGELRSSLDDLNIIDGKIAVLISNEAEKLSELEKSNQICKNALNTMKSSPISKNAASLFEKSIHSLEAQIREKKLNANGEYKNAVEEKTNSQNKANALNEKYLGAVEYGNKADMETLKAQIDIALADVLKEEEKIKKIENEFDKNNLTDTTEQAVNIEEGTKKAEQSPIDQSEIAENLQMIGANEDIYTSEEKSALQKQLAQKNGDEMIAPWFIVFEGYSIKLTSPIIKKGKDIYVPYYELANKLGAQILKSKTGDTIIIKDQGVLIEFGDEMSPIYVNDKKMPPNLKPLYSSKKIYIPLRCFELGYGWGYRQDESGNIYVFKK